MSDNETAIVTVPNEERAFIMVSNIEKYQHYKDRNPPWVKLYQTILSDYDFRKLPDNLKFFYISCLLLASRTGNRIPFDWEYLKDMTGIKETPDINPLISNGMLKIVDASIVLATCKHGASPEVEKSTEKEEETDWRKSVLQRWNALDGFPKVLKLSESRKTHLRARHQEPQFRDNFAAIFKAMEESDFMRGINERKWIADFDWIISNDSNYIKVLEGKYKNKARTTGGGDMVEMP